MRLVLPLAVLATLAGVQGTCARAADLPPRAADILAAGHPFVEARPDPSGVGGLVTGAIDISAPPHVVWSVMTECERAARMVASLQSCRILERDPAGRWDVREFVSRPSVLLSPVRNVFRSDYQPDQRITFHRTGGDLAVFEGEWRVEPRDGPGPPRVRVSYSARVDAALGVPRWMARLAVRAQVRDALLAFRREAEARSQR